MLHPFTFTENMYLILMCYAGKKSIKYTMFKVSYSILFYIFIFITTLNLIFLRFIALFIFLFALLGFCLFAFAACHLLNRFWFVAK